MSVCSAFGGVNYSVGSHSLFVVCALIFRYAVCAMFTTLFFSIGVDKTQTLPNGYQSGVVLFFAFVSLWNGQARFRR